MLNLFYIAHLLDDRVVTRTQKVDKPVFFAGSLDAAYDLIALFPLAHEHRDEFHRVLKVGAQDDGAVAARLQNAVVRAVELAEILRVENGLHMLVLGADLLDDLLRSVL